MQALRRPTVEVYLARVDQARLTTHVVPRGGSDADLDATVDIQDRRVTNGWIVCHVLEHMVAHYGQIHLPKSSRGS